jgi:murein DD-endopeptidase MepM/ murein hydrolase activator NlpD
MRVLLVFLCALVATGLVAAAASADRPARARAEASALAGSFGDLGSVATRGGADGVSAGFSVDGASGEDGEVSVSASTGGGEGRARAAAIVRSVSLFGGLVRAARVRRTATAADGATTYTGRVDSLRVGDRRLGDVTAERSYELPGGAGTVTVNRGREALQVVLAKRVEDWPAGTVVAVGSAHATAEDAVRTQPDPTATPARPTATPEPSATREPAGKKTRKAAEPSRAKPRAGGNAAGRRTARAERAESRRARRESARLAAGEGFTFPVAAPAEIADDWGGPRQIGPHQGNDIFAPFGAPVVAVADGRVEKVGTLDISGNRLWVRTDAGDTFFYAHLASFAPAADTGRRVKKGTVLGYVGNTGDAEPTPPHLHFEVHPGDGNAIDPHEILTAWQERAGTGDATDAAERPGALVEVRDLIDG